MISALILFLLFSALFSYYVYINYIKLPKNLEHIPAAPIWKNLQLMLEDKPQDVKIFELSEKQLNATKIQAYIRMNGWGLLLSSSSGIRQVFNDPQTFQKRIPTRDMPTSLFAKFQGDNVVFSNLDDWKRHRRLVNPPFKKQFEPTCFEKYVKNFFKIVEQKGQLDVHDWMQRITMDSFGKALFGVEFDATIDRTIPLIQYYNETIDAMFSPIYMLLFKLIDYRWNPWRKKDYVTLDNLEEEFRGVLQQKKQRVKHMLSNNEEFGVDEDILTLMIKASLEDNSSFNDELIRNNIMIFLLAGHDTTAFALSCALHLLAQNPDVQRKARDEVLYVMQLKGPSNGPISETQVPTFEQCKHMNYLMAIMKETMRLYPSVPRLPPRIATKDVMVDGYLIPKGTEIDIDIFSMHRDPDTYPNPHSFIPERFVDDSEANIEMIKHSNGKANDAWMPFGGGVRLCLGINFSLLEQKVVLAMILSRYHIYYDDKFPQAHGAPLELNESILFSPKDLKLNFKLLD